MLATILTVATSCDKAKEFVRSGQAAGPPQVDPSEALDLSANPTIIFQVFGEASDPRMIPIAAVEKGRLRDITLSKEGWEQFDAMFLRRGKRFPLYRDGLPVGDAVVKQGMWEREEPLYTLPSCQTLTPLAAVSLDGKIKTDFTVEFLAATDTFSHPRYAQATTSAEVVRQARALAYDLGGEASISKATLDSLDFRALAVPTGVGAAPTIVASFVDPTADDPTSTASRMVHLLFVADPDSSGRYRASYVHRINGPLETASFRRYSDHADLDGNGTDELVLEGWQFRGDTFLLVLGWKDGKWEEVFRSRSNWCLDERKK